MKIWAKRAPKMACAAATCSVAVVVLSACGIGGDDDSGAAGAARHFAAAMERQDAGGAAGFTTAPGQAGEALTQTLQAMNAEHVDVDVVKPVEYSDGTASFSLKTTWRWAKDRSFETTSSGTARHLSTGWKLTWEPSIIYPGLPYGGQLREIRTDATPAPTVRSKSGKTFMYLQPVNEIILDPNRTKDVNQSARALARTLAPIAPLVTTQVISQKLAESQGKPIKAVTLRDPDMEVMTSNPDTVPGVSVRKAGMLVMADRRLSSPLEPGITNYWQAIRDATAGWQVQMVGPGIKPRKLAGEQGPPGPSVDTTIDQNLQLTLGDAAVEVGQPATIMALDAGSGAILGMAQNSYAVERGINANSTHPVGSTLNPVLGEVDRTATATQQSTDAIMDRLGLGVQFTVPGASAPTADQPGVTTVDFRPGDLNASMMNMGALGVALARSSMGQMSSVPPFVIKGAPTSVVGGKLGELDAATTAPILQAMAVTAKTGDASDLTGAPGLRALVGTNGPQGPGWFLGLQGGKVIVIYCEGDKSGTAALQVAQKYFRIK
ncbi:peptidase [Gordonia sp. SID5947]|uniref:NTF2-like N-terminal transpeptidase domain-containing protein n=1 Tax=Gordonia sp. SID5947 TaxID=2690315 RepID=UPI00136F4E4E|nr:NTF2-like N-terminal transpeptidase domain-containing protein [Gordonia sp. SID5947]MYR07186.1 peptidase [Gordonia sp. SID5947]